MIARLSWWLLLMALLAPTAVRADDNVRVFQRKPFLRRERVELSPAVGITVNDALVRHHMTGGHLAYHLSEQWAAGAFFAIANGEETDLFLKIQQDYALNPIVARADYLAMAEGMFAALYGKFILFNTWNVHFDTSAVGGLGVVGNATGGHPAIQLGVLQRFFLNRWLTTNLSLRQVSYVDDAGDGASLFHVTQLTVGASFFYPDFDYRTFR